jgi:Lrp/AsnC family transcriptional regulator for asnA, asnC and gidA
MPEITLNFVEIGKYNIRSVLGLKHTRDLGHFVDSLKKVPHVNDVDVMIWSDIGRMAYPGNLVIETFPGSTDDTASKAVPDDVEVKTSSTSSVGQEPESGPGVGGLNPSVDKIDESILRILSQNARIPFSTIAKQIGISTKTVICRYRKLKKDWVVYTTLAINLRKLGYPGYVSYNIKVSSKSWVKDVFERLIKIPNIIVALKLIGPYNINALAPFSTPEQLMKTHASISEIPGIDRLDQQIGDSMHVWPAR